MANGPIQPNFEQTLSILAKEAFRSRRLVVAVFVAINAALLIAGLVWPKGYTAFTTILVDEKNIIQPLMQGAAFATEVTDRARIAREVIHGRKVMNAILEHAGWLEDQPSAEEQERIIDRLTKRTSVTTVGKNIIKIEYRDDDPERAFRTTDKLASLFIEESRSTRARESKAAFDFIDKQTQEYHEKLSNAEQALKEVRIANLDARAGTEGDINTRLGTLQTRIEQATQELREAEIRKASLERQLSGEAEMATVLTREGQYRTRIAELQQQLDTLRLSYHDSYPDIVRIRHQISDLGEAIAADKRRREIAKVGGQQVLDEAVINNPMYQQLRRELSQTEVQLDTLKARITEGRNQLAAEVGRGKQVHGGEARLAELTRDYQVNRDIYQDLLRRRENARVSMNLDVEQQGLSFKVQEPAVLPLSPTGLRFIHFVAAGLLLGILVPIGGLYARMQLDPRVHYAALLPAQFKYPVLASVPHLWRPDEAAQAVREARWMVTAVTLTLVGVVVVSMLRLTKVL